MGLSIINFSKLFFFNDQDLAGCGYLLERDDRVYRFFCAYGSPDNCERSIALLKGSLHKEAWLYQHDLRECTRRIAPFYATSSDYADTLGMMDRGRRN
jgi:hypothetical protein